MTSMRWTLLAFFLAALAANASCGRKGDPVPPAASAEEEDGGAVKDAERTE